MSKDDVKFSDKSLLDILIPEASELNIEEALGSSRTARNTHDSSLITSIQQRTLLFFDEKTSIYVILRTPYQDESILQLYISRLTIAIEAHAISSLGDGQKVRPGSQTRDVIWSEKVDVKEDPIIVVEESAEDKEGQDFLVIWKLTAFLSRPRIRLQAPAIIFKLSASLQPIRVLKPNETSDPYLPSRIPFPENLLQPLQDDPALNGNTLQLSASRLSRVSHSARSSLSEVLPLRIVSRRAFGAIPAISARLRYHRSAAMGDKPVIVASLDIEIPPFAHDIIDLQFVRLRFIDGNAEELMNGQIWKLPQKCHPRDNLVFLYHLSPDGDLGGTGSATAAGSSSRSLDVLISALVLVSDSCRPRVEMRWRTSVDFSMALSIHHSKTEQSTKRISPLTNLSGTVMNTLKTDSAVSQQNNSGSQTSTKTGKTVSDSNLGIIITITTLSKVYVGEPFRWEVFLVNRSNKPRRFAIVAIPKRRNDGKQHSSRPSSTSSTTIKKMDPVADAAVDENVQYAATKSHTQENAALICLTTDIKIGPLNPGACYTAELKFLALTKGHLQLEVVRIIDLPSEEMIDVRDLPDLMVFERSSEDRANS